MLIEANRCFRGLSLSLYLLVCLAVKALEFLNLVTFPAVLNELETNLLLIIERGSTSRSRHLFCREEFLKCCTNVPGLTCSFLLKSPNTIMICMVILLNIGLAILFVHILS